jgi:haloacid dehalogenase superfamily, subfamily IA, variant 1 with third motif having Dx(3-4)D or Dx(3-4)E
MKFDLVCIDMFQTLVNLNTRIPFIWKRILRENYSEKFAYECAKSVSKNVVNEFHQTVSGSKEFINLKTMFKPFFESTLKEMNISFDAKDAVNIFLDEHTKATPYDDVENFFTCIDNIIPVCLVTDADYEMVLPTLKKYKFDEVFISEKSLSYKNEPNSKIFNDVLRHYSLPPERILHIGDSSSDIAGANRVGIKTCWINRENRNWTYTPNPDYVINSLSEVINILEENN